jgi:MoxR-like ATPase
MNQPQADSVDRTAAYLLAVRQRVGQVVVGQDVVVERALIALLTSGHLLLQGVPGLAKTLLVSVLSRCIDLQFARIQFTIDLLPSDILGSEILDQRTSEFRTKKGPIFTNLLLADEINRAAPKVQGALLEAMQERRVTIGDETWNLPAPFLVIATQNPVEQAGTFELRPSLIDSCSVIACTIRPRLRSPRCCGAMRGWESSVVMEERSCRPNLTSLSGALRVRQKI